MRGAGDKTLRDASSRATKAFYPALSLCDLIFSGVFERHPRLGMAIVEFELAHTGDAGTPIPTRGGAAGPRRRALRGLGSSQCAIPSPAARLA
jgi:hypothetical protein